MKKENEDLQKKLQQKMAVGRYLTELLSAVLAKRAPRPKPDGLTWDEIRRMAKRHSVQSIAYAGAVQAAGEEASDVMEEWLLDSGMCIAQGKVQMSERSRIFRKLTGEGIRILPLKGCVMKELYPLPEYRQMADLDILVDPQNMERAGRLLLDLGFSVRHAGESYHDAYEKKPWLSIELHRQLLELENDRADKYRDVWEKAFPESPGGKIYRMTWEDFYIFMIEHFFKHFYFSGSGIRSVMDIYVFLDRKGDELDLDYLHSELKRLGLWEFEQKMRRIAEKWFGGEQTETDEETEAYIITSGVYGTKQKWRMNHMGKLEEKYRSRILAKIRWIWELVWLNRNAMRTLYPVLDKYPYLCFFCRIHRVLICLTKKRDMVRKEMKWLKDA